MENHLLKVFIRKKVFYRKINKGQAERIALSKTDITPVMIQRLQNAKFAFW